MQVVAVENVAKSVESVANCGGLGPAFEYLESSQPHLAAFSVLSMDGFSNQLGIKAMMLGYMALQAFENQAGGKLPVCSFETFIVYGRRNQDLLECSRKLPEEDFSEIMWLETSAQPYLMEALRTMIVEHFERVGMMPNDIKSIVHIYLTVKSIVEALDSTTN